jgi:reactive intermediate/imine deaminase
MRQIVHSSDAPQAIGPYSQAVRVGQMVYLSGQVGIDPKTGDLVGPDVSQQAIQVFENLSAVAKAAGGTFSNVIKLTIYLTDMLDYPIINDVMARYVASPYPARVCFSVTGLPMAARVEVDAMMVLPGE